MSGTARMNLASAMKIGTRRAAWLSYNLFMGHVLPLLVGTVTKVTVGAVRSKVSVPTPWLSGRVLSVLTADGAVIAGLRPDTAWAKYALPKGLPTEGRVLGIENDPHLADDFDGEISQGYGKGVKTLLLSDSVIVKVGGKTSIQKINYHVHKTTRSGGREHYDIVVTGIEPGTKQWELHIPRSTYQGRYAFIHTGPGTIVTRMTDQGLQIPKPGYILRREDNLANVDPATSIIERKIDGSLGNAHVQGQRVAFRSHRDTGETYYDRLPAVEFIRNESPFLTSRKLYPGPQLTGTVFQGELTHPEGAARVAGILNSLPQNARALQERRGPITYYVWDILKYKGRDVSSWTYEERRNLYLKLVDEIRTVNKSWFAVECSRPEDTPVSFYERVTRDPLPWGEGVVIKHRLSSLQKWDKIKLTGMTYWKVVEALPGEGKYAGNLGRLLVENPSNGARGEIGSFAVPDEFRSMMWKYRDDIVGQTIKARVQSVTERGAPRAGVFVNFHDGDFNLLMNADSLAVGDTKEAHRIMYAMKTSAGWRRK